MPEPSQDPLLVLVAGPYRSGTGDDPALIARNLDLMNDVAYAVYERGHVPITGEAIALPLAERAGSTRIGDAAFDRIFHPSAVRLLTKCDAVLRVGGASAGADEMVRTADRLGKRVFHAVEELPEVSA